MGHNGHRDPAANAGEWFILFCLLAIVLGVAAILAIFGGS